VDIPFNSSVYHLLLAVCISALISAAAYKRGSLSLSGAPAAWLVGSAILGLGGWHWGLPLLLFFFTSTLLSHAGSKAKEKAAALAQKGERRDAVQVAANGGIAALAALGFAAWPAGDWYYIAAGALAAATADTWATELGTLSKTPPRRITTGRPCPAGTSGGVSALGLAATTAGALLIGLATLTQNAAWLAVVAVSCGGLAGSLFDSLLGATVQRLNACTICGRSTERDVHCDQPTLQKNGLSWLQNDVVNALATLVGGLVSWRLWLTWIQ
jgi:uncharacterized protein (TIGR00297 family)